MTNESKDTDKPAFKTYRCPECNYFLAKGVIKKLRIQCPECRKIVTVKCDE